MKRIVKPDAVSQADRTALSNLNYINTLHYYLGAAARLEELTIPRFT